MKIAIRSATALFVLVLGTGCKPAENMEETRTPEDNVLIQTIKGPQDKAHAVVDQVEGIDRERQRQLDLLDQ